MTDYAVLVLVSVLWSLLAWELHRRLNRKPKPPKETLAYGLTPAEYRRFVKRLRKEQRR